MKNPLCSYIHCKSRNPGTLIPVIRMWASTFSPKSHMPAHVFINDLRLCENCAQTAKVHEIMTDKRWAEICKRFTDQGAPIPNRDTMQLLFKKNQVLQ